jgi:hypothetical protein
MSEQVDFTVLENGLDFISSALGYLEGDPSPRDLKYAVLHLSAGIELILKDRLRREHWSLVFADMDKADLGAYSRGDFVSVDLRTAMDRLGKICNVNIREGDRQALNNLRRSRNRLEHFACPEAPAALKATTAEVLCFVIDFVARELPVDGFTEIEAKLLDDIRKMLPAFRQFVEDRMAKIESVLNASEGPLLECPTCLQDTMEVAGGVHCAFCNYSACGEDGAEDFVQSVLGIDWRSVQDGDELPIYVCPECDAEALVYSDMSASGFPGAQFLCFSCGANWDWGEMDFCIVCGAPFPQDQGERSSVCDRCQQGW